MAFRMSGLELIRMLNVFSGNNVCRVQHSEGLSRMTGLCYTKVRSSYTDSAIFFVT